MVNNEIVNLMFKQVDIAKLIETTSKLVDWWESDCSQPTNIGIHNMEVLSVLKKINLLIEMSN